MLRRADDLLSGPVPALTYGIAPAEPPRRWRVPAPHLWALLAITIFGGWLRLYNLEWPALWNDDTLVFWRVCGTYGQMLVPLHDRDLFPPLHYSLYWWLGHPVPVGPVAARAFLGVLTAIVLSGVAGLGTALALRRESVWVRRLVPVAATVFILATLAVLGTWLGMGWIYPRGLVPAERTFKLTPFVMRMVPTVFGIANIPAIYFLARQLLPRGTSLVAALVTACSAFMHFYSRDCKMYSDGWLLITLNVGCLLWWFRTGLSTAWLCWVASGCAMVGLNGNAAVVPGVTVVFLFTQRRLTWQTGLLFVLGLGLIFSGLGIYYTMFSTASQRIEARGWSETGLGWVGGFFNGDRTGPDHVWYTASSYLAGYEWPRDAYLNGIEDSLEEVPQRVVSVVVALLAIAALPWPLLRAWIRPDRQAALDRVQPEPAWRVWLWLGAWIVVPAYGYYCHSVDAFASPMRWLWELTDATSPVQWTLALVVVELVAVAALFYRPFRPMVGRTIAFWLATAGIFGLCWAVFAGWAYPESMKGFFLGRPWGLATSIWEPRYIGIIWPAVGVGVAALLMRLPTRPVRAAAVTFFCLANLFMVGMRMTLWTEPPIDRLTADIWAAQDPHGPVRTYDNINRGGIAVAQTNLGIDSPKITGGRYYLQMLSNRQPMSPDLFEQSLSSRVANPYTLRERYDPGVLAHDLRKADAVQQIVLWTQLFPGERLGFDPYRSAIPKGFRLAKEEVFPVRVIWDWREYWKWVRREYVRTAPLPEK